MSVTGMVCPRTGEFYALMFSHTDTQVFQVFLDHANQDIALQRKRNILICTPHGTRALRSTGEPFKVFFAALFARSQSHRETLVSYESRMVLRLCCKGHRPTRRSPLPSLELGY